MQHTSRPVISLVDFWCSFGNLEGGFWDLCSETVICAEEFLLCSLAELSSFER
jgi:hypothetical protein